MQAVVPTCRRRPAGTLLIKEINVDQRAGVRPQGDLPAWVVLVDLQQLLAFVARAGVTPEALFQGMAVTAAEADEPGCLVTRAEALALMRRVLRILKDPLAGLHIESTGPLGPVFFACDNPLHRTRTISGNPACWHAPLR